jgi:hypothetical protein
MSEHFKPIDSEQLFKATRPRLPSMQEEDFNLRSMSTEECEEYQDVIDQYEANNFEGWVRYIFIREDRKQQATRKGL